jgi:heat shock protein HtpX
MATSTRNANGSRRAPQRQRQRPSQRPRPAPRAAQSPERDQVVLPPPQAPIAPQHAPRAKALVFTLVGLPVVVAVALAVSGLVIVAVVLVALVGVLAALSARAGSSARLLAQLGGREAKQPEEARLINVAEGLCVANGLAVPRLMVLDDAAANALVVADRGRATLLCTTGALELLDRLELEGLVAHELAHLKRRDARDAALAWRLCGLFASFGSRPSRLLGRVGDPAREIAADLFAAQMTRYPPGLGRALEKLAAFPLHRPRSVDDRTARLTAPFWCIPLEVERGPVRPGVLDIELRIAALAEL